MDQGIREAASKSPARTWRSPRRDLTVALLCGACVALMVGAAYAAVPLYDLFCRVTGFGGTPQIAAVAPGTVLDRKISVRFDANIARGLPWRFVPEVNSIDVKLGEVVTVYYDVINRSARATSATAGYNVTPPQSGAYFTKVNCFCFTEQHLKPGEKRQMAVVFYIDPSLATDADMNDLNTITLSYTFYPTDEPQQGVAANAAANASGRI
ncbi:MAG: cytochrome c oxidase assembly protein [Xanthobacteraceae bacterium]